MFCLQQGCSGQFCICSTHQCVSFHCFSRVVRYRAIHVGAWTVRLRSFRNTESRTECGSSFVPQIATVAVNRALYGGRQETPTLRFFKFSILFHIFYIINHFLPNFRYVSIVHKTTRRYLFRLLYVNMYDLNCPPVCSVSATGARVAHPLPCNS